MLSLSRVEHLATGAPSRGDETIFGVGEYSNSRPARTARCAQSSRANSCIGWCFTTAAGTAAALLAHRVRCVSTASPLRWRCCVDAESARGWRGGVDAESARGWWGPGAGRPRRGSVVRVVRRGILPLTHTLAIVPVRNECAGARRHTRSEREQSWTDSAGDLRAHQRVTAADQFLDQGIRHPAVQHDRHPVLLVQVVAGRDLRVLGL